MTGSNDMNKLPQGIQLTPIDDAFRTDPGLIANTVEEILRHLCLGAHLARVEAQEAILGLLARYPNLERSKRGYVRHAMPSFRGFSEFWVKAGAGVEA